jgi:hypothetical protein
MVRSLHLAQHRKLFERCRLPDIARGDSLCIAFAIRATTLAMAPASFEYAVFPAGRLARRSVAPESVQRLRRPFFIERFPIREKRRYPCAMTARLRWAPLGG